MLNCYIVDDSPSSIRLLTQYIDETEGLQLTGSTVSGLQALQYLLKTNTEVDLVFLDIDIEDLSGLTILDKISDSYSVILVSGHRHYGEEAFIKGAAGYLFKPLEYDRFYTAIQIIKENIQKRGEILQAATTHIFVPGDGREVRIRIEKEEIKYVQAAKNFCSLFLENGDYLFCSMSLKQMEMLLKPPEFLRISKSIIVNTAKIIKYDKHDVYLKGDKEFSFGDIYRSSCLQVLKSRSPNF